MHLYILEVKDNSNKKPVTLKVKGAKQKFSAPFSLECFKRLPIGTLLGVSTPEGLCKGLYVINSTFTESETRSAVCLYKGDPCTWEEAQEIAEAIGTAAA
jgi:hypothetical protein